jgi:hypothetical protein
MTRADMCTADHAGGSLLDRDAARIALRKCIKPGIPARAQAMANDVDQILLPYIMPWGRFSAMPQIASKSIGTVLNTSRQPQWAQSWLRELTKIFETALSLRLELEEEQGLCSFEFPHPGQSLNIVIQEQSPVLTGLFPLISARFPVRIGGELSEPLQLSEALYCCTKKMCACRTPWKQCNLR